MLLRRVALALTLVALFLASPAFDAPDARAQSTEDVERAADRAASEAESAYQVVSSRLANRAEVEAKLLAALDRYTAASAAVAAATARLDRLQLTVTAANSEAVDVQEALEEHAVAAYIQAMSAGGELLLATDSAEHALVTEQFFDAGAGDTLQQIDMLTARRGELDRLADEFAEERARVTELEQRLAEESSQLESLFSEADEAVADAYRQARSADVAYREALTAIDRARAAEETPPAAEEPEIAAPTTTTVPDESPGSSTTTTTTVPPPAQPPAPPGPAVERWRPVVQANFAPDLVEDALRIIGCESKGDPAAVNPYSGASGLFQFLPSTWAVASVKAGVGDRSVFDGEANTIAASWLAEYYRSNGSSPWAPWACRHNL